MEKTQFLKANYSIILCLFAFAQRMHSLFGTTTYIYSA